MEVKVLVMMTGTRAHALNEATSKLTVGKAKEQMRSVVKYLPYLASFRATPWRVESYLVQQAMDTANYDAAKKWTIDHLRKQGYKVV